jgi:hypothetical protein
MRAVLTAGSLGLGALSLGPLASQASASCAEQGSSLHYDLTQARATFVVRPACFGSRAEVGDVTITYGGRRCTALGCTSLPAQRRLCRWSRTGCTRTLEIRHPGIEQASYQFDMSYVNAATFHVVAAGAETVATSCTSLAVTYECVA